MTKRIGSDGRGGVVTACVCAVVVLACIGALDSWRTADFVAHQYPDIYGAGQARTRFAALLARVPPQAELGYFTDLAPEDGNYSAALLTAQYAVAPRLLSRMQSGRRPELAVGNFSQPLDFAAEGGKYGYVVEEDLGGGVVLYRKKGQ